MFSFQANPKLWRKLYFAVAVAILLAVASCSNQPANQASDQTTNPPLSQPAKPAANQAKQPAAPKPAAVSSKVIEPQLVTVPKGSAITATVAQTLATDKSHPGDSFAARLSTPVLIDGKVVIPKGAQITGRVVTVKKHELKVALASVKLHGKSYDLATNSLRPSDKIQDDNAKDNATQGQASKDKNATLLAQTRLTFKLTKPATVPVKG
jgi:hypothetical protein